MSEEFRIFAQRVGKSLFAKEVLREEIQKAPKLKVARLSPYGAQYETYEAGRLTAFEWKPAKIAGKNTKEGWITDDPHKGE